MKHKLGFLILLIVFLNGCEMQSQTFLKDSKDYISPFENINSEILLNHLDGKANNARIIGLGEVSHYTKECYEFKHQIIKKLIEKGYDGLVLEVDFGQALLWNDYLTSGQGNIDTLVAQSGWFTYRTQEFKNLLIDIREFNLTADKPFQIFGMEMTAMHNNLAWLAQYFSKHLDSEGEFIDLLKQERTIVAFQKHEEVEIQEYRNLYATLRDVLLKNERLLIANGGEKKYELVKRIGKITKQYITYISEDDFSIQLELRDQFSTKNVLWCLDYLEENSKIAIWAHNGHVAKKSILFNYDILGFHLNNQFGEAYYSIGFTFNEGEFGSFSSNGFKKWELPAVTESSLTQEFDAYQSTYLLFDIRSNLKGEISENSPLKMKVPIRTDISEFFKEEANPMMNINLSKSYDCLIYIDKTNYPTTIDKMR